jgi:hypothetical protein
LRFFVVASDVQCLRRPEESARLYQPLVIEISLPGGKSATYADCSTGFTVEMIKFRACDENDLRPEGAKIFYGDAHLTPDPLSFNDFPSIVNRGDSGPLKLRLEYGEPL